MKHKDNDEARIKIKALKAFGITNEDIAKYLGMSVDTLNRNYQHELDIGQVDANFKVASCLFKKAVEQDDLTAQIFWLKTRGRWRTEDNKQVVDSNEDVARQMKELRADLDKKNRKEY